MRSAIRAAALAVLCLLFVSPLSAQELGKWLASHSVTRSVWVDFDNINVRRSGAFNSAVAWASAPDCWVASCIPTYEARYGAGSWRKKGNLVGERYSYDLLLEFFRANGIKGEPTRLDREDAVLASLDGRTPVWDSLISRPAPPPPPVTSPSPPPVVPPPVTPPAPAPSPYPLCDELTPAGVSPGLRVTSYYRPSLNSTAIVTTTVCREKERP